MGYGHASEHGGSRASTVFWLLVLAAVIYATVKAGPIYYTNFMFQDKLQEIARTPPTKDVEARVRESLQEAIKYYDLNGYMTLADCRIHSTPTSRTISCEYEREVKYLPGFTRMVTFRPTAVGPNVF